MKHFIRTLSLVLTFLLVGILAVGLTACTSTPENPDTESSTEPTTDKATTPSTDAATDAPTEAPTDCVHVEAWRSVDDTNHEKYCSECHVILATEAHVWDEGAVTTEPTLDAEGVQTFTCTVCGLTRTEAIERLNIKEVLGLDVQLSELDPLMKPIFAGSESANETVMFLDPGDRKTLLYPIDTILSVTSYDGTTVYEEGKDYIVEDGQLKVTADTSIPCITSQKFYNSPGSIIQIKHDGKTVSLHWGEGRAMTDWQVNVNYTHSTTWEGYTQASELAVYQNFIKKLQAGEDVTVFFYGDSITYGANASWINGYSPRQYSYPILFTQALADLFAYTVHYESTQLASTSAVPAQDYVAGDRGTITYVNTAVGGWTSQDGVSNLQSYVTDQIRAHGCDLFVLGFGMNDAATNPKSTSKNLGTVVDAVLELQPEASIVLLSTMVPNPDGIGWYGNQVKQEPALIQLAASYRRNGVACAVSCMTSVSQAVLERKDFHDYSGNNINHPNDFFVRIYAQTLLQTVIGYENLS